MLIFYNEIFCKLSIRFQNKLNIRNQLGLISIKKISLAKIFFKQKIAKILQVHIFETNLRI